VYLEDLAALNENKLSVNNDIAIRLCFKTNV